MPKITQDIDGKIIKSELSSEEASELAHKRWSKHGSESLERLISQAGYSSITECPEHLQVLGKLAVSSRSGAVAAMRAFLQLTGRGGQDTPIDMHIPADNEACPLCGRNWWGFGLGEEMLSSVLSTTLELIQKHRAELAATTEIQALARVDAP